MKLKNKVALITGSSSNIGKAIALQFAKEGAKIITNSRKNKKGGQETVNEIKKLGAEALYIQADVGNPKEANKLIKKTVSKFGRM